MRHLRPHDGHENQCRITWRNRGEVTGLIGYRLESGRLRLIYRNTSFLIGKDGAEPVAEYAAVYRTARRLFEGRVLYRTT